MRDVQLTKARACKRFINPDLMFLKPVRNKNELR